jgi:hypothetical protein
MSEQRSTRIEAFAAISIQMIRAMREAFPIEGLPWQKAGEPEGVALKPFLDLLPGFAACWWVRTDKGWTTLCRPQQPFKPPPHQARDLRAVVTGWRDIFRHYQWGEGVYLGRHPMMGWLDRRKTQWAWPDVPLISKSLLDVVEQAAQRLLPLAPGDANGDQHDAVMGATKASPNPWLKRGPLDLTLNTNDHTVTRQGQVASFAGQRKAWEILFKLTERYPARYLPKDLGHDVWNPVGNDQDPEDHSVQQAISTIRNRLNPIGIDVGHERNIGYYLTELNKPISPKAGAKKRRRKTPWTEKR